MATRMKYRRSVGPLFLRRTTKATLTTQSPFHFPFHIRRVEWSVSLQKPQHIRAYIYHVPARCFPVSALFQSQTCARPRIGNGWLGSMRDISLREAPHDILRCFVDFRQQRLWDFAIRFDEVTTICGFWLFWIYSGISWYMLLCCVVKAVAVVSAGPLTYSSSFFFVQMLHAVDSKEHAWRSRPTDISVSHHQLGVEQLNFASAKWIRNNFINTFHYYCNRMNWNHVAEGRRAHNIRRLHNNPSFSLYAMFLRMLRRYIVSWYCQIWIRTPPGCIKWIDSNRRICWLLTAMEFTQQLLINRIELKNCLHAFVGCR